ncbi:hypothetical protein [Spiroplasma endosymbiont of Melieria omissa]
MKNTNDILDEEILEQNKDKLPTYEEAIKFQQKINKSDFLKMK